MLMLVKPGSVLISLMVQLAVGAQEEIYAGEPLATERAERLDRKLAHFVADRLRQVRGHPDLGAVLVEILGLIGVEAVPIARRDLAGQRSKERTALVLENAALDLATAAMYSSTRILRSCRNASAIAWTNSSAVPALLMPTDEPSRAGLTNSGRPSSATAASNEGASPRAKVTKRAIGRPASRMSRLATSLSIAAAEPRTPEPT